MYLRIVELRHKASPMVGHGHDDNGDHHVMSKCADNTPRAKLKKCTSRMFNSHLAVTHRGLANKVMVVLWGTTTCLC